MVNGWNAMLRSPVLWGAAATVGFFALVHGGAAESLGGEALQQFVLRYAAGHPVEYAEFALFFVGIAALVLKRRDINRQLGAVHLPVLPARGDEPATAEDCDGLLAHIQRLPRWHQETYLVQRIRAALVFIQRKGDAESLDDELHYLSELDDSRVQNSYGLPKIVIWAVPILGFLGTVVGVTMAIAALDPTALEQSLNTMLGALAVAFDTTALALTLSIVLMFTQFSAERLERRLLAHVEDRTSMELTGRFASESVSNDPQLAPVRRMAESVIAATETLVRRQSELWQRSLELAESRWSENIDQAGQTVRTALAGALDDSLQQHARQLAQSHAQMLSETQQHWKELQHSVAAGAESTLALQKQASQQTEALQALAAGLGETARLEEALNRNLATLAGAHHFEETLASLAGVIHLLNARLTQAAPAVESRKAGSAAGRAA